MHLALRARATRPAPAPDASRGLRRAVPLVLAGFALGACSAGPQVADPAAGAGSDDGPTGPGTLSSTSPSPGAESRSPSPRASATPSGPAAGDASTIRVEVAGRTYVGQLYDNPTARDLADQLPLTVTMDDLHGTEKTGRLRRPLTRDGAPRSSDPEAGEIGYYAPGQDLVLYYGDGAAYAGIIRIGRFSDSIDGLADEGDGLDVRVEAAAR